MTSKASRISRISPVPESFVPPEDLEILLHRLRRATPLLLRGFASASKTWELRRLWEDAEGGKQVELQVSGSDQQNFHGFGGLLQRVPLGQLQRAASEAQEEKRSLYLVQCPIWSRGAEDTSLGHLLPKVTDIAPFTRCALRGDTVKAGSRFELDWAKRLESANLWASIGDTHSNLHYDSKHGLLILLRGTKQVEIFPPSATPRLGAYEVTDPLRSHHSKVPHCCLAARLKGCVCASACWPKMQQARSFQTEMQMGDALLIPEGWWHHVKTSGVADPSAGGQPVAIAMNLWWSQYAREPKSARPYILRRLLGDMLASRTASHFHRRVRRKRVAKRPATTLRSVPLRAMLQAAQSSKAPKHHQWLRALRSSGDILPQQLAAAAGSSQSEEKELLADLLGCLDAAQVSALLSSLDSAAAEDHSGAAAAALRQLWRVVPQRALLARWQEHLRRLERWNWKNAMEVLGLVLVRARSAIIAADSCVTQHRSKKALGRHSEVAPPGAGKTTAVPLALLDDLPGGIVVTEPRRMAARAAARRMASMLGEPLWQLLAPPVLAPRASQRAMLGGTSSGSPLVPAIVGATLFQLVPWVLPHLSARAAWCWPNDPPKCVLPTVAGGSCINATGVAVTELQPGENCTPACDAGLNVTGSCTTLLCPPSVPGSNDLCTADQGGLWWPYCGYGPACVRGVFTLDATGYSTSTQTYTFGHYSCADPNGPDAASICGGLVDLVIPGTDGPTDAEILDNGTIGLVAAIFFVALMGMLLSFCCTGSCARIWFKPGPKQWTPANATGILAVVIAVVAACCLPNTYKSTGIAAGLGTALTLVWSFFKLGAHDVLQMTREAAWRIHAVIGMLTLVVGIVHGVFAFIQVERQVFTEWHFLLGFIGLLLMIFGVVPAHLVRYDKFKLIHFMSFWGFLLCFIHMIGHAVYLQSIAAISVAGANGLALLLFFVQKIWVKATAGKVETKSLELVDETGGQHLFLNMHVPNFSFKAGQWGHLTVPSLGSVPHPFTLVPGDGDSNVRIFMKINRSGFTAKLAKAS
eukprot:s940_g7.t1